jgi:hypothetical protein
VIEKSFRTLILISCAASLVAAQDSSVRSSPKKHATPANSRSSLLSRSEVATPGRFRGQRHTPPGIPPHRISRLHTSAPTGRSANREGVHLPDNTPLNGIAFRPELPAGQIPTAVTAADFNGDGKIDGAVSNGEDNTIWTYLGNGDGTSALPTILPLTGVSPNAGRERHESRKRCVFHGA